MKIGFKEFTKRIYDKAVAEDITTNAAQVAFYFIFALFRFCCFCSAFSEWFSVPPKTSGANSSLICRKLFPVRR